MKKIRYILFVVGLFLLLPIAEAQEDNVFQDVNVDDLGVVTDEFQEAFFEALKQKGIENYDRAIEALDKCIALRPTEAILYFEKGKNLALSGDSYGAEANYLKALQLKPNQRDILESLYEVYYAQQDFEKAIGVVQKLVDYDIQYKEDLARIYVRTKNLDKALAILDELDEKLGKDTYRSQIRQQVYALSNGDLKEKEIQNRIEEDPESEQNYLNLIYVYSEQGETQKAYETAQKLLKINPKADIVHLALYKFNLEKGDIEAGIKSMERVLKSTTIDTKAKHSVLNDFLIFVDKNPEYEMELENAISLFSEEENIDVNQELGSYYLKHNDKVKALAYYLAAYEKEPENIDILKNLMMLQIENGKLEDAVSLSDEALALYPSQPIFYLIYGVAKNGLEQYDDAIEYLELGLDYVIDQPAIESDFYKQLAVAYKKAGNPTKASEYRKRASTIMQ